MKRNTYRVFAEYYVRSLVKLYLCTFYLSRDAFAYVYSRRGCVTPYESFLQQLHELEPILRARADVEKAAAAESAVADPR